jgi:DHA1 family tetracycline resistance protein-like MFS transporter
MGLIGASFAIGFTLGPTLGGIASIWGYSTPMYLAAGLSAVNLLSAVARLPESPRTASGPDDAGMSRLEALRVPGVSLLTSTNFVFSFAVTQLETIFALYMLDRFAFEVFDVAMVLLAMAIVMGGIQGGGMKALSKRFGERSLIRSGAVLLGIGFFTTPLMPGVPTLIGALMLAAAGRALLQPSLMTLISFRTGEQTRGAVMSTFQSASALARVFGPFTAGWVYDRYAGGPFWVAAAASVIVFLLASGLVRAPEGGDAAQRV